MSKPANLSHGHTRRWHNNPNHLLRNSIDTVDAHQARMHRMRREIFPGPCTEIDDAICDHDLAEIFTGDWSRPDKDNIPGLDDAMKAADAAYLEHIGANKLADKQFAALKLLDQMDALYWVSHVARDLLDTDEWRKASSQIMESAEDMGEDTARLVNKWRAEL